MFDGWGGGCSALGVGASDWEWSSVVLGESDGGGVGHAFSHRV